MVQMANLRRVNSGGRHFLGSFWNKNEKSERRKNGARRKRAARRSRTRVWNAVARVIFPKKCRFRKVRKIGPGRTHAPCAQHDGGTRARTRPRAQAHDPPPQRARGGRVLALFGAFWAPGTLETMFFSATSAHETHGLLGVRGE